MAAGKNGEDSTTKEEGSSGDTATWRKAIKSALKSESGSSFKVKKLRKVVLLSLQHDDSDKASKKQFKRVVQEMERDGTISLDADGNVKYLKVSSPTKRKESKSEKKSKKKRRLEEDLQVKVEDGKKSKDEEEREDDIPDGDDAQNDPGFGSSDDAKKNKPCRGNPQGVTRLFLGNLPFAVDESSLGAFLPGEVTHIKWITDKETGKFYGSAFVEMDNSRSAAEAVAMAGSNLIGRPVKINFAPARQGDVWPPVKKVVSGSGQAGGSGIKAMSAKPDNCVKLFIGNLSYEIDDDALIKFFASVDAEVKGVRWLHHIDSGDFKGCGFCEFWNTEACEKAATLNGKNLLGRPIRIDWSD